MLQRLMAIARKELIQIRRDRRTMVMMIALPILWLVMFGYAFSFDVKEVSLVVIDQSDTRQGQLVADAFRNSDRFRVIDLEDKTEAGIRDLMFRDGVQMGLIIPAGYGERAVSLNVLIDGADLFAAQTGARMLQVALEPVQQQLVGELRDQAEADLRAQVEQVLAQARAGLLAQLPPQMREQIAQQPPSVPPVGNVGFNPPASPQLIPQVEILYNPELKSANVMIPGLLGMVLMFMTTLMTALGVVREREYGTMEQLVVTPIRPFELMLGKLLPYFLVGAFDFGLVYVAGTFLFDLTFQGNLLLFLGLSLLLVLTTLSLGLLLSTVAQNQQQAMQMVLMTVMPQFILSGLIFPLTSMPKVIQYIGHLFPFTYYVPIARGMFIKGQGMDLLWPYALVLAVYAVVMVLLASLQFRKRLA